MIVVIDYGSGNLRSVAKALESVGGRVRVSADAADVAQASHVVLPGVGAFSDCRRNLEQTGVLVPMMQHLQAGRPFLGICVGMQLLFSEGHEFGVHPGLDLIPGQVVGFSTRMADPEDAHRYLKVPHIGWNQVHQAVPHPLWHTIPDRAYFYSVHSFHAQPTEAAWVVGRSQYGIEFTSAVARDNLFATQFHPEKSQKHGLQLLRNFVVWKP